MVDVVFNTTDPEAEALPPLWATGCKSFRDRGFKVFGDGFGRRGCALQVEALNSLAMEYPV